MRLHINNKKKSNDSGVAMIFALIVGVVILTFCLMLLLVAYTLFSQTSRVLSQSQCKILSQTMADQIADKLEEKQPNGLGANNDLQTELKKRIANKDSVAGWKAGNELVYETTVPGISAYTFEVAFTYVDMITEDMSESTGAGEAVVDDDMEENGLEADFGADGVNSMIGGYPVTVRVTCIRGDSAGNDRDIQQYSTYKDCTLE